MSTLRFPIERCRLSPRQRIARAVETLGRLFIERAVETLGRLLEARIKPASSP